MTTTATDSLFGAYASPAGAYDEMRATDGSVRPHWDQVITALEGLGPRELDHRRRETERLLRQDGVTYNVYDEGGETGDRDGRRQPGVVGARTPVRHARSTPWVLDPIPMLLDADEWATIERGLVQRAELYNLILTDLYGPRELVRKGLLPLELVYGHRGFLRQVIQNLFGSCQIAPGGRTTRQSGLLGGCGELLRFLFPQGSQSANVPRLLRRANVRQRAQ